MRETKSPGDTIDHGQRYTRYGMVGDSYISRAELDARAEALFVGVHRANRPEWLTQTVLRLRLGELEWAGELGYTSASYILAKADVTWSDICRMKS
jgi:hypothetical protein